MRAYLIVFGQDPDADAFAADVKARQRPGGATTILMGYGNSYPELGGDAGVFATMIDPGTVMRPDDVPDVRNEGGTP